jgi:ATP-dependent exoDNAse (exonuclease V) beta subunit
VPSIAIFVNTDKEAAELEKAMKEDERLENAGIDVKNCTFNDELEKQDSVRIFLLNKVKGMEFEVVFFHNIDKVDQNDLIDRYLYVGLSRATFYMAVTSNPIKDEKLEDLSEQFKKEGKWKVRKR